MGENMQRTLLDFARLTEQKTRRGEIPHVCFCRNCVLDLNSPDANKFQTRFIRRQLRVMLEPISGNLMVCPRCQTQHYNRDFYKGSKRYKKL
jgi:hypothetical protein